MGERRAALFGGVSGSGAAQFGAGEPFTVSNNLFIVDLSRDTVVSVGYQWL